MPTGGIVVSKKMQRRRKKDVEALSATPTARKPVRALKTVARRVGKKIARLGGYRANSGTVMKALMADPYGRPSKPRTKPAPQHIPIPPLKTNSTKKKNKSTKNSNGYK